MLTLELSHDELWDEDNQCFIPPKKVIVKMEHSLISISKWEQKWHKPFLSQTPKTIEEQYNYIECMITSSTFNKEDLGLLSSKNIDDISKYIEDTMTATVIHSQKKSGTKEIYTSELIYYYMFTLGIPVEFERWHLNRLLTLIELFGVKNQPEKKMTAQEAANRNAQINAERRAKLNSKG